MDINIEDILKTDYYRENKKRIKYIIDGEGKEEIKKALNININNKKIKNNEDDNIEAILVWSFIEKECKYIIKFYSEMKVKYEKECGGFINSSMIIGFLD